MEEGEGRSVSWGWKTGKGYHGGAKKGEVAKGKKDDSASGSAKVLIPQMGAGVKKGRGGAHQSWTGISKEESGEEDQGQREAHTSYALVIRGASEGP